jgi:hypothetical protein
MAIDINSTQVDALCILNGLTPAGSAWMETNLPEDAQRIAGGIVVEPRYIDDILKGAFTDGMVIGIEGQEVQPA